MAVFKYGDKDMQIKAIQDTLGVSTTGKFYSQTQDAVKKFQKDNDLPETGEVDDTTLQTMIPEVSKLTDAYITEMNKISGGISSYPNYKTVGAELEKYVSHKVAAAIMGCVIQESGARTNILNKREYNGKGSKGTNGWNCGEGLIQWTYWTSKASLIKAYNKDSRITQKLPEKWDDYNTGEPKESGNLLLAKQDGKHISGLSLKDQVIFLVLYYGHIIKNMSDTLSIPIMLSKFYQYKAGPGHFKVFKYCSIHQAYFTGKFHYQGNNNTYLESIRFAQQYYDEKIVPNKDKSVSEKKTTTKTSTKTTSKKTTTKKTTNNTPTSNKTSTTSNTKKVTTTTSTSAKSTSSTLKASTKSTSSTSKASTNNTSSTSNAGANKNNETSKSLIEAGNALKSYGESLQKMAKKHKGTVLGTDMKQK